MPPKEAKEPFAPAKPGAPSRFYLLKRDTGQGKKSKVFFPVLSVDLEPHYSKPSSIAAMILEIWAFPQDSATSCRMLRRITVSHFFSSKGNDV